MAEEEPDLPAPRRPPGATPPRVLDFEDDGATIRGVAWRRRALALVAVLAALAMATVLYRAVRGNAPATQDQLRVDTRHLLPATVGGSDLRSGLTALPSSELSGVVGSTVDLTVRAVSSGGAPLADRWMAFRVTEGSAELADDSVRTDADGMARTSVVLPATPGRVRLVADLGEPRIDPVGLVVEALPGAPRRVVVTGGDGQTAPIGELLSERLGLRVTDAAGNPVPDVAIQFDVASGGGLLAPSRARTDSLGRASALWRLGATPGRQVVAAWVPVLDRRLDFTATATGAPVTADGAAPEAPAEAPTPAAPPPSETGPPADSAPAAEVDTVSAPAPVSVTPRSFTVGGGFVCATSGGTVSCRGANDRGQRLAPSRAGFVHVAAGGSHACGLTAEGEASCWGANDSGQLGDGSRSDRARPVPVIRDLRFSALAAGASHTCGLAAGGRALCWGSNLQGQLGDGSRTDRAAPAPVAGGHAFVRLVAGWNHTCGLTASGEALCWGLNDRGQLGDGSRVDRLVPARVTGRFESLAAGSAHTCGVRGDQVLCWGSNDFGQLGDGSTGDRAAPGAVAGLPGAPTRLAAGAVSTCALLADGSAHCWGQNLHGQLGDGSTETRRTPSPVAGGLRFTSIQAGGALTCAFTVDGAQYCWGLNQSGQLGDGSRVSRSVPTPVGSPSSSSQGTP